MTSVDLLFLCAQFRVDERALQNALRALLVIGEQPLSIERIAENACYSAPQLRRALCVLTYDESGNPPFVERYGGGPGVAYRYRVNKQRACEFGLIDHAA